MRRYPHTVTFSEATEARQPSGAVTRTWSAVSSLTGLRALVIAAVAEDETERAVLTTDLFQIIVEGDRAVLPEMTATTSHSAGTFEVIRVVRPVPPMPNATIVTAERVSL